MPSDVVEQILHRSAPDLFGVPRGWDFAKPTSALPEWRRRVQGFEANPVVVAITFEAASMKTLRFLSINRATRLARISGRNVLRVAHYSPTQFLYNQVADRFVA